MKYFDYESLNALVVTPAIMAKMNQIYELRGQQQDSLQKSRVALDRLVNIAKVESTDASNRIEGVYTSDTRLRELVNKKTTPHNRSEAEISGYRDVLELIHEHYQDIPITSNSILGLHKQLFNYTESTWGGHYKDINNTIVNHYRDGSQGVRFTPPPAHMTPELVDSLCRAYNQAIHAGVLSPLLLAGAFVFDFVSIHPFRDGNGRISRLLMLLTLYQNNFLVGKFVSIEQLIERTKSAYYERLQQSSTDWMKNGNSYAPFLDYFLSIILQAYRDLNERINITQPQAKSAAELVLNALQRELRPLSKRELLPLVPEYSQRSIERALLELQIKQQIEKIGRGRATRYRLV